MECLAGVWYHVVVLGRQVPDLGQLLAENQDRLVAAPHFLMASVLCEGAANGRPEEATNQWNTPTWPKAKPAVCSTDESKAAGEE